MPYYDYIDEFLGVDRDDPPEEISQLYRYSRSNLAEYSWLFNEIICSSLSEELPNSGSYSYFGKPSVNTDECKTLCNLIIRYGGEQQHNLDETKKQRGYY